MSGSVTALGAWGHEFIHGQLSVAIFIKGQEGGGGIGDFGGINDSVVIGVESGEQGRHRGTATWHSRTATLAVRAVLTWGRALMTFVLTGSAFGSGSAGVLCGDDPGGSAKCKQGDDCFRCSVHMFFCVCFVFVVLCFVLRLTRLNRS